jgi:class 3 adenylate cyclase/Tol biopolymer transport system component
MPRRSITTVLFTDIVGSTDKAAALGDRRWRELLGRHHNVIREELARFDGEEITTAGDGFLAVFANPASAIACAASLRDRMNEIDLEVRCGIHLGQVERSGGDVSGITVHIGARVAAHAGPNEVLVSATVREAERGSEFEFEDRGRHELKGVPGDLGLYALVGVPEDLTDFAVGAATEPTVSGDARPRRFPRGLAPVGLLVLGVLGVWIWSLYGGGAMIPEVLRTTVALPADQALDTGAHAMPIALSPDGRRLAYVAESGGRWLLHIRDLGSFDTRAVEGTDGASYPFFSPDGQWVAFFADKELKRVSLRGGSPITVCPVPFVGRGGTWGPGGTIVFDPGDSGLMSVAAEGGTPEPVASRDPEMDARDLSWPQLLPDGNALLATVSLEGSHELVALSLDDGEWRLIGPGSQGQYVPPGWVVFHAPHVKEGEIEAMGFDPRRLEARGQPVTVLEGVFRANNGGGAYFAVSPGGTLLFARGGHARTLVRVDRNGRRTPLLAERLGFRFPAVAPDGRRVALTIDPRPSQLWVYDLARGSGVPLATEGHNLVPIWSPDGRRIAWTSRGDIVERAADASDQARLLISRENHVYPNAWTRDGRTIVFMDDNPAEGGDILVLGPDEEPHPLIASPAYEQAARLSPDQRWIAYASNETGRSQVYVRPFPEVAGGKWLISTEGGEAPAWSPTGRELFYANGNAVMAVAIVTRRSSLTAATPETLFTGPFETGSPAFDVLPDGSGFVMVEADPDAKPTRLEVVVHWTAELESLIGGR